MGARSYLDGTGWDGMMARMMVMTGHDATLTLMILRSFLDWSCTAVVALVIYALYLIPLSA